MCIMRFVVPFLVFCNFTLGQTPVIEVLPSTSVMVGEEVCFIGSGSTVADPANTDYEWDLGDDRSGTVVGANVTHFYMHPGTFTVTLTIGSASVTDQVTVTGNYSPLAPMAANPALDLRFENNLNDASGNGNTGTWLNGTGSYIDGLAHRALDVTGGRCVTVAGFNALDGVDGFTATLWAKNGSDDAAGTILALPGVFRIRTGDGGNNMRGYVTSTNGSENSLAWYFGGNNNAWHQYALLYDGTSIRLFCDGQEAFWEETCPRMLTGAAGTAAGALHIGCNDGGTDAFNGFIDNVKIYNRVLTPQEIGIGFELWHADFNGRLRAYVYTQIPSEITADPTNRLQVTLAGGSVNQTLADKNALSSEEVFLVDRASLARGEYLLTVQLLNAGGTVLHELVEKVSKQYDGLPVCGLDENNSIRVNGELFFPVTPWNQNDADVSGWGTNGYINAVLGKGFWPEGTSPASWEQYLDIAQATGLKAMGPTRWDKSTGSWENYSVVDMRNYIDVSKDHPAQIIYHWGDEPDLKGVKGASLRSQTFVCHYEDPTRITGINFAGATWQKNGYSEGLRKANYNFLTDGRLFGRRTTVNDIYTLDYYPVEWAAPANSAASFDILITIMSRLKNENYNLVPIGGFVETCDIREIEWGTSVYPTPWHPTPGQLKMNIWINIVTGARLLSWFHYHSTTPPENLAVMADFVEDITVLKDVVLGPECAPGVTITAPTGVRVEHMERLHQDTLYIFTVRVSESDTLGQSVGSTENVTINLPAEMRAVAGAVYDEARNITVSGNSFTDSYGVNDVHIYKVPSAGLPVKDYLPNRVINRPAPVVANPAYREISIAGHHPGVEFEVYNFSGQLLGRSSNGVAGQSGGNELPAGVYLVKFGNSAVLQRVMLIK